jgi:TolB-like protein/Flp pilus assembly protein TadD
MPSAISRYGDLELDPANFEVRLRGRRVKLDRIPLELLLVLAARAGQLVKYQEAFEAVWGKGVVIEVESALYTAIRKVRRALGEDPRRPRFIETVARKGYRFIAQPSVSGTRLNSAAPEEAPKRLMLAVLPLENLSGDPRQDYFSDGLTEELISELGRFSPEELGVIARTSVMGYKGTRKSVAQIGEELGVDFLIEGSVRHERGRVRIAMQLITVNDQTHVWAETYERPLLHILSVQTEVGKAVAEKIRLKLVSVPAAVPEMDPEVYDMYLRGRYLWDQRTAPAIRLAIRQFEQALARDSSYAPAWAGLASCYATLAITSDTRPRDAFPRARETSDKALALNQDLPQAHIARGIVFFWSDWNWTEAEREFRRAAELDASSSGAWMFLAHLHSNLGRHAEALREIVAAQRLDPVSRILHTHQAHFLYNARHYDEATSSVERVLELTPRFWVAHIVLGKILGIQNQFRPALAEFAKAHRYSSGNTEAVGLQGYTLAMSGHRRDARRVLRDLVARSKHRYVPPMHRAMVLLGLGDDRGVAKVLNEALDERDVRLTFLGIEPRWDPLRANKQFKSVCQHVGLPTGNASPQRKDASFSERR